MQKNFATKNLFLFFCFLVVTVLTSSCDHREQEIADQKSQEAQLLLKLLNSLDDQLKPYNVELITHSNQKISQLQMSSQAIMEIRDEHRLEGTLLPKVKLFISTCRKLEELDARDDIAILAIDTITLSKAQAIEVQKIMNYRIANIKQEKAALKNRL